MSGSPHGDLLRIWRRLEVGPDPALRREVARMLHLDASIAAVPEIEMPVRSLPLFARILERVNRWLKKNLKLRVNRSPPSEQPLEMIVHTLPSRLESTESKFLSGPAFELAPASLLKNPPKPPLLNPRWVRCMVSTLCSTPTLSSEFDIPRLVRELALAHPMVRIPRRMAPSLELGVRCWLDRSLGMQPLFEDQFQVLMALRNTVGEERVTEEHFTRLPLLGSLERDPGRPSLPMATPWLILSDFGLRYVRGREEWATPDDWAALAERARASGVSKIIGLVPCPERTWPARLTRAMDLLFWDRSASILTIRSRNSKWKQI